EQSLRTGLLGLGSVCVHQGSYRSAEPLLEEAVAVSTELGDGYAKATALHYLGQAAIGGGDYRRAGTLLSEAHDFFREAGPPGALVEPLVLLGHLARVAGKHDEARRLLEESLALARAGHGSPVLALRALGELAAEQGDPGLAHRLLEESLALGRGHGDERHSADALHAMADLARAEGDRERAAVLHHEALALRRKAKDPRGIVASLASVAGLVAEDGRYEHAARLFAAAQAVREEHGYARAPWESERHEADLGVVCRSLAEGELKQASEHGAGLSVEQAVAQAASALSLARGPVAGWPKLTEREQEVAFLVAEGLTNRQIADCLFISLETVKNHVSKVLSKLAVTRRTELARELWRRPE
ncbi:MAG: tetratricopeptide repeat protein, partial [Actinobacteria bacterium]|nr:tetratricopeptide repeat protein [Actinomycetota bacterium]